MKLKQKCSVVFHALFHRRNVIIMSERSTSHMSMSTKAQVGLLVSVIAVIGGASFSTGKYMAAQQVISDQGKTIKSVAQSRIETNYNYGVPSLASGDSNKAAPSFTAPLTDPSYSFSTLDEGKLVARVGFLENRVRDLNQINEDIVTVVRKTAAGQIKDLEGIIQKTSLSPEILKRHAKKEKIIRQKPTAKIENESGDGAGGPFIPAYWDEGMRDFADELDDASDELYVLRQILDVMPTAKPMTNARRSSSFGHRRDPFTGRVAFHSGLDFVNKKTPQIVATSDGRVSMAERRGAYGNLVEIKHGLGLSTRYAHLSRILVKSGDRVKKGQVIGIQGSTGRSTGAHLHYEVRFNNRPLNPNKFLAAGESYVQQN